MFCHGRYHGTLVPICQSLNGTVGFDGTLEIGGWSGGKDSKVGDLKNPHYPTDRLAPIRPSSSEEGSFWFTIAPGYTDFPPFQGAGTASRWGGFDSFFPLLHCHSTRIAPSNRPPSAFADALDPIFAVLGNGHEIWPRLEVVESVGPFLELDTAGSQPAYLVAETIEKSVEIPHQEGNVGVGVAILELDDPDSLFLE